MLNTAQKKEIAQLYSRIDRGTASDEDWERFETGMATNLDFKAFWLTLDTVTSEALVEPTLENPQQADELRRVAKQMADGDYIPTMTETPTRKPWYLGWIIGAVLLSVVVGEGIVIGNLNGRIVEQENRIAMLEKELYEGERAIAVKEKLIDSLKSLPSAVSVIPAPTPAEIFDFDMAIVAEQGLYDDIKRLEKQFEECKKTHAYGKGPYNSVSGMVAGDNTLADQLFDRVIQDVKKGSKKKEKVTAKVINDLKPALEKQREEIARSVKKCEEAPKRPN